MTDLPPPLPPTQRHGCLMALMILAGVILLLPGICAFLVLGFDSSMLQDPAAVTVGLAFLAISACGIALIWVAIRRPR